MRVSILFRAFAVSSLLVIGMVSAEGGTPQRVWAATSEWAAVQRVVGPTIDPQAFLYPVMNATGYQAMQLSALLEIPGDQFLTYQNHPASMMAAIQRFVRRLDVGTYGVMTVESLNAQADIFNVNGLSPQEQADLIARLATQPLATTYLAPLPPSKPTAPQPMYRPTNPVTVHFRLPDTLGGKLAPSMRAGTGCSAPCAPLADYEPGTPATFTFQVAPPLRTRGFVNGIYWIGVYKTIDAARSMNLRLRDMTSFPRQGFAKGDPSWMLDLGAKPLPIAAPVASNEWLRGYQSPVWPQNGMRDCYAIAGVRYNNVLMVAQADNYNSITPPGYVTCQTSYKWSTRVLAALYARAQTFK